MSETNADAAGSSPATGAGAGAGAGASRVSPLRVAIVGCGIIGRTHAQAMLRHPQLHVAALIDAVPAAAESLAAAIASRELGEAHGATPATYASLADAFAADSLDVVVICTSSGLHVQLALEALALRAHVIVEKPLDVGMRQGRALAEAAARARENGQVVSVISQHRFDPASIVVAEAAHGGAFGSVTSATASVAWWRSQRYYDSGDWRGTWRFDGGGAVMNQGVHTVDLLVWFLGVPVEISAETALLAHERVEIEDVAVATIRFESGALATVHATTTAFPGLSVRLQVHGTQGSGIIDDDQLAYFASAGAEADAEAAGADDSTGSGVRNRAAEMVPQEHVAGEEPDPDRFTLGHLRQYDDIVRAIQTGGQPGVTVEDALLSLAVVRGIYASATLGTRVSVGDVLAGRYDDLEVRTAHVRVPSMPPSPSPSPSES